MMDRSTKHRIDSFFYRKQSLIPDISRPSEEIYSELMGASDNGLMDDLAEHELNSKDFDFEDELEGYRPHLAI